MKQIDNESLIDIQQHQENLNKQQIKQAVIRSIADSSAIPHKQLQSLANRGKHQTIAHEVTTILECTPEFMSPEGHQEVAEAVQEIKNSIT